MITSILLLLITTSAPVTGFLAEGGPRRIRLISDPAPDPAPVYEGWTRSELQSEYDRLEGTRPGIGLPVGLMAGGGGAVALAILYTFNAASGFGGLAATQIS